MNKIKVLLVDDHALVRDSIAIMLAQTVDIQIVGRLSSGEDLINKFRDLQPDIIIMDIFLKGISGIEATRWVKERSGSIKIVLLSREVNKELLCSGIQCGIDGYLSKKTETDNLIQAIRRIYAGEKYFDDAIVSCVFEDFYTAQRSEQQKKKVMLRTKLSKREMQVLSLIVAGYSYSEIGEELSISTKTVDTHKTHILDKLGLKNTVELVKYALKNELISIGRSEISDSVRKS
jgi:DNA-binding NarL/FixJ family response regulator